MSSKEDKPTLNLLKDIAESNQRVVKRLYRELQESISKDKEIKKLCKSIEGLNRQIKYLKSDNEKLKDEVYRLDYQSISSTRKAKRKRKDEKE